MTCGKRYFRGSMMGILQEERFICHDKSDGRRFKFVARSLEGEVGMPMRAHLHKSWRDLLTPFASPPDVCEHVFAELVARYSRPERHYHTLTHIAAMLELLPDTPPALALAVWFHDAIYDSRAADNE